MRAVESLKILEHLTRELRPLEDYKKSSWGGWVEYECPEGFSIAATLYTGNESAVCRNWLAAGTVFPEHNHDEYEVIVVEKGEGFLLLDNESRPYKPRMSFELQPGQPHSWRAVTDTVFICIAIPASDGYPQRNR